MDLNYSLLYLIHIADIFVKDILRISRYEIENDDETYDILMLKSPGFKSDIIIKMRDSEHLNILCLYTIQKNTIQIEYYTKKTSLEDYTIIKQGANNLKTGY